jgi:hypothetical protein
MVVVAVGATAWQSIMPIASHRPMFLRAPRDIQTDAFEYRLEPDTAHPGNYQSPPER